VSYIGQRGGNYIDQRSCRAADRQAPAAENPGHWIACPPRNPMAVASTEAQRARTAHDVAALLDQAADDLVAGHKFAAQLMAALANERAAALGLTIRQSLASFASVEESPSAAYERIGGGQ